MQHLEDLESLDYSQISLNIWIKDKIARTAVFTLTLREETHHTLEANNPGDAWDFVGTAEAYHFNKGKFWSNINLTRSAEELLTKLGIQQ